jgi:archaellum component FlaC
MFLSKSHHFQFTLFFLIQGKEARRKELKKNKKQRQQVREAVIKRIDPKTIFNDLDALDKLGNQFGTFSFYDYCCYLSVFFDNS